MNPSDSNGGPEASGGRDSPTACDIALDVLADPVDPNALDDLFTHRPDTIDSVVLEIDGATLELWENDGLYARVLEDENEDKEE